MQNVCLRHVSLKNNRQTLNDEIIGSQQLTLKNRKITWSALHQKCSLRLCDGFIVRSSHAQFLFMRLDVFFRGGSIIRSLRLLFLFFSVSLFNFPLAWFGGLFFFNAFPRHSVVRQVIEIYFSSCALPSSSFSSHFNCYYCHGGFKWHATMQATTKTTRSLLLHQKVSYFARYRHVVIRLAFPSFVIPAIFIYHCLKAVIKHILHHNYFFSLHFKQFHKLFVVGFFSSSVRSLCKWRMGGVCLCNIAIKMVTC